MEAATRGATGALAGQYSIVMLMLTDPPEDSTEEQRKAWETTCDRCGTLCKPGEDFHTGSLTPNVYGGRINITFGLCSACKALEVGGE
jgi:hypothetical protein